MNRFFLLLLILFTTGVLSAQVLQINGSIVIDNTNVEGTKIVISKNNQQIDEQVITKKGKFDLKLALGADYRLSFEKDGYVAKILSIDTEVPQEIIETNPDFPPVKIIINLLPEAEDVDISIFSQPIAILAYDYELDDFNFDKEYASKIKDKIAQTEQAIRKSIALKGSAALEKEQAFSNLVAKGQERFDQRKWQEAIDSWTKALTIKPNNSEVKEKIALAEKENIQANEYKALITSGDGFFGQKKYEEAKAKYAAAIELNKKGVYPDDNYPAQKINEINSLLAQLAKAEQEANARQSLIESYKLLIANADRSFDQKKYDEAEPKYQEALALNYENEHPSQRIKAIADIRKQEAERLKQESDLAANYSKIISAADNSFNTKVYKEAIKYYQQAMTVKPSEAYPKEMIAKAEKAIALEQQQAEAEAAKKQQEELRKAELMNQYKRIIAEADKAFVSENYAIAKSKYTEADVLNTGEIYPKNKIKEVDNIFNSTKYKQRLAEFNKNKELAEKAATAKNYASAKFYYQKAIDILPLDAEAIQKRIAEIDKLIETERLAAINKEYGEHIAKADKAYHEKSYAVAKFYYEKALEVKKDDAYAQKQLEEVKKYINERTEKTVEL